MNSKLYILHGWAYDTTKWGPFLQELKKNGVEGKLLKIPGLTAPLDTPWNLDDYIKWLHTQTAKSKDPIYLLGHSNGGRIALGFTLSYPEKVKQLFLLDSAGLLDRRLHMKMKRFSFELAAKTGKKILPDFFSKPLYRLAREHDYEKATPVVKKTLANLIKTDLSKMLHTIKVRTIIIWGEKDTVTPLKDAKVIHKEIKKSQLFFIHNARHSPQFTHPAEVVKIVCSNLV